MNYAAFYRIIVRLHFLEKKKGKNIKQEREEKIMERLKTSDEGMEKVERVFESAGLLVSFIKNE